MSGSKAASNNSALAIPAVEFDIVGVVLAGGKSERMGVPKAFLKFQGETLLARAIKMLSEVRPQPTRILVSGSVPGYECVSDASPGMGPVGGLRSVVTSLLPGMPENKKQLMIAVPIDMPLLTSCILSELLINAIKGGDSAYHYQGFSLPLVLEVQTIVLDSLNDLLKPTDATENYHSVNELLNAVHANSIPSLGFGARAFKNVNTPDDWQEIASHLHGT